MAQFAGNKFCALFDLEKFTLFWIYFTDEPEVSAEHPVVHGGLGRQVELSCLVYADPPADVVWYRDTMRLDPNGLRYMESR